MKELFIEDYRSLKSKNPGDRIDRIIQGELYSRYKKSGMSVETMAEIILEVSGKNTKLESVTRRINLCIEKYEENGDTSVKGHAFRGEDKVDTKEKVAQNVDGDVIEFVQGIEGQEAILPQETSNDIVNETAEEVKSDKLAEVESSGTDESTETWEENFPTAKVMLIPVDKLEAAPDAWNFFQDLNKERFEELKLSIKKYGIQHNLVVQEIEGGKFRILSGHQRVKACKELFKTTGEERYKTVPCKAYKQSELADEDARRIVIFTNTAQRGDLSLEDRVRSVEELTELEKSKAFYGSGADVKKKVAEVLGVSRSAVFRLQNLASLDKKLLAICGNKSEGKAISVREGEVLSKLTKAQQNHIFDQGYYKNLTPGRLSALKNLTVAATEDDIDKIFGRAAEYRYSVVTTVKRPDGFETIGVHVKPEEKVKLGEFLKRVLEGDSTMSEEVKKSLISVAEELTNSSDDNLSSEDKKDAAA